MPDNLDQSVPNTAINDSLGPFPGRKLFGRIRPSMSVGPWVGRGCWYLRRSGESQVEWVAVVVAQSATMSAIRRPSWSVVRVSCGRRLGDVDAAHPHVTGDHPVVEVAEGAPAHRQGEPSGELVQCQGRLPVGVVAAPLGRIGERGARQLVDPLHSGPVEGTVNRIKQFKAAMYGRADPDLLRKLILLA